jgi:uncharacterized protein YbjT (DUF2867 family)/uncharacterized membrane protein YphA (DoxX/SURF4 family)
MKILVCGANGFIGRHLCGALERAGHEVVRGVRVAASPKDVAIDFAQDLHEAAWLPRLANVDAVVNAVGILQEEKGKSFAALHRDGPIALFKACERLGVKRAIQISALGGAENDDHRLTPYMRSKRQADAWLMQSGLEWAILRPSLVVGTDGASSALFRTLASLPIIALPGTGKQRLQPVHVDDVCAAVVRLLEPGIEMRRLINVVGPEPMNYREMLAAYRRAMNLPVPVWLPIPMPVMRVSARLAAYLPQRVLSSDTLRMLEEDNVADSKPCSQLLGREPRGVSAWFAGTVPAMLRAQAVAAWALPMFRVALAIVWIITGLLSLGIYPVEQSLELLSQVGLRGPLASATLMSAALLDVGCGLATLFARGRTLWRLQMALIVAYTMITTIFLPAYWLHPFGPILKNIPILALLLLLDAFESKEKQA